MLTTIQGVYRNGKIELAEEPLEVADETQVIVTFLPCDCKMEAAETTEGMGVTDKPAPRGTDLRAMGIDKETAARIRASLTPFAKEWDTPEMEAYNDYEANKAKLL